MADNVADTAAWVADCAAILAAIDTTNSVGGYLYFPQRTMLSSGA